MVGVFGRKNRKVRKREVGSRGQGGTPVLSYTDSLRIWFGRNDGLVFDDLVERIIADTKDAVYPEVIKALENTIRMQFGDWGRKRIEKAISNTTIRAFNAGLPRIDGRPHKTFGEIPNP